MSTGPSGAGCSADLATPAWLEQLDEPAVSIDAVLTATALHWLPPGRVAEVYAEATGLLPRRGLVNTDTVPDSGLASLAKGLKRVSEARGAALRAHGDAPTWSQWCEQLRGSVT